MKKLSLKKIWLILTTLIFCLIFLPKNVYADESDLEVDVFNILPELNDKEIDEVNKSIAEIWQTWWNVWQEYNKAASGLSTSQQISSWIMNRDTLMNYIVFVVQFLSQLWLVVWTVFIIYAWYKYMVSVFWWGNASKSAITNAIIWVIIVIFSYAIMRILTSLVWLT